MPSTYLSVRTLGRFVGRVGRLSAALCLALSALISAGWKLPSAQAAGTISGVVFQDFNQDGLNNTTASAGLPAVDLGVAGVQVRAYDSAGTLQGSATTGANGSYTLTATGTGPYRVEFTVPAGYQPSAQGTNSGTTIQFVPNGGGTASLGLTIPADYCQNNPLECTSRYVNGDAAAATVVGNTGGLVAFPENSTSAAAAGLITSTVASNIGATWGLAWHRNTNSLFAAAVAKRHTSFGPGGSGAIYKLTMDPTTGVASATSVFVDMATITGGPGATGTIAPRDLASGSYTTPAFDADAFAKVGKISLGDLDISDDGQTMYVVSLTDRTLYALNIGANAVAPASTTGTTIALPVTATVCPNNDLRPWAVDASNGQVYVGVVCSAETSHNRADLRAYVLQLNGAAFDLVTEFALSYPRGCTSNPGPCYPAEWQPWRDVASSVCNDAGGCVLAYGKQVIYPQPLLSDIEFDRDGSLVVGLMDRSGNQWGNNNYGPGDGVSSLTMNYINASGAVSTTTSFTPTVLFEGAAAGDILRLCPNGGGYTLESNSNCGGTGTGGAGSSPAQGPGGGEFYWQDMYTVGTLNSGTHNEITLGGLKLVPGRTELGTVAFDSNDDFRAGGITWFSNTTGQRSHSFEIFGQDSAGSMGKAGGLGDLEALCANAPIEIGNRVWVDSDRDGLQDPNENAVSGVTVNLFNQGGTQIGTATTDANGAWYFGGSGNRNLTGGNVLAPNTAYQVRVPLSQSVITTNGYTLTTANVGANASDSIDSDASVSSGNAIIALTTGSAGANNHTYDIGFTGGLALGNLVWGDRNNNGLFDAGESGIDGVTVQLLSSGGTPLASTTTAGGGLYLFSGLVAGDYIVRITPPAGYCSSTGTPGSATGPYEGNPGTQPPDPDNDVNNDDNGNGSGTCGQGGYVIDSGIVTLLDAAEPVNDGDSDSYTNLSVDFGLIGTLSLGNLVWSDVNNNGLVDVGEPGLDGITVRLLNSGGTQLASTTTAGGGLYGFSELLAGDYVVEIIPPAGYCSSTGAAGAMTGSGPYEGASTPDPDNNVNNDDNGTAASGTCGQGGHTIRSAAVTLSAGAEPTNDGDSNANSNLSVDFGLFPVVSLGNLVWADTDNSGTVNGGETGLNGITVRLYTGGGALVTTVTTAGGGLYSFPNLAPGDYYVEIVPPANTCSSTGTAGSATGPYEGNPGAGQPPDPDNNFNSDDNGYGVGTCGQGGYVIRTSVVTLTGGAEPTNDGDSDANSNLSVDFGLIPAVSLGNLVWVDTNNNGLVDGGETGLDGVAVRLYTGAGSLVTSTTTAGGGLYLFSGLSVGDYYVEITPPAGYCSSTGTAGSATGPYEGTPGTQPPDPDNNVNNDDNGYHTSGCGTVVRTSVVTLASGAEPTNDGDSDANSNLSVDFGLIPVVSLGNLVWNDGNNNGVVDGGEAGVDGLPVRLYTSTGTLVASTTTAGGGLYSFANLTPGDYYVEVTPPTGTCSSSGTAGSATGPYEGNPGAGQPPDPDNNTNNDDNGNGVGTCGQPGFVIRSGVITLSVGAEPTNDGDSDASSNLTVDFGLVGNLSLGNLVWIDANNNGLVDGGEAGVNGVTVRLLSSSGTQLATTTTAGGGLYGFANLPAGDYIVEIVPPAGYCSSTGTVGSATGPYEGTPGTQPPDPDNNTNNDDNGNGVGACGLGGYVIRSSAITLSSGAEPTNDGDSDANSNLTVDFGLVLNLSLGNLVWNDANNNGLVDGGEFGVDGLPVRLYTSTGTLVASTTTAGGGLYSFVNLPAGDYYIEVTPTTGTCSSSGTVGSATGPYEGNPGGGQPPDPDNNTNNDDNGNGVGTCGQPGYVVRSGVVTLAAGTEPTNDGDTDNNSNLTIDFGLVGSLSLGNLVWNDANNNGLVDGGEAGVNGVTVRLLSSSGTLLATTTTAGGGLYGFANLPAGDYIVEIVPPAGYCSSTGTVGSATGPYEGTPGTQPPDPDNNTNNDDNGNGVGTCGLGGYVIRSSAITLSNGAEPTNDGDSDANSNLTVDFGILLPASLGNFVWSDANSNGLQDGGEAGVGGVVVTLRNGSGTTVFTTTTAADGSYLFPNLPPGTYSVCFSNIPVGSSLTGQNAGGNDAVDSDADPATGCTGTYTLTAGQQDLTVDAGLIGVPTAATVTAFTVTGPTNGVVTIEWATAAEIDVFTYRVYRSASGTFATAVPVCDVAATGSDSSYSCTDTVPGTGPYTYWLTEVNAQGNERIVTEPNTVGAIQVFLHIPSILKR